MSTWHPRLFITPVSCLLLYKTPNRCRKKPWHWSHRAAVYNTCCSSTQRFLGPDRWPLCSTRPHICSSPPSCDCSLKMKYWIVQHWYKYRLQLSTVIIQRNIWSEWVQRHVFEHIKNKIIQYSYELARLILHVWVLLLPSVLPSNHFVKKLITFMMLLQLRC